MRRRATVLRRPGPTAAQPYGVYRPATVPADLVPQYVHVMAGGDPSGTTMVESVVPGGDPIAPRIAAPQAPPRGPATVARLGRVLGTRSGDKGGDANLGVFARTDVGWAWLDDMLTVERLHELLPETATLVTERYRFPAIRSVNFVIRGLLEEGVAASTRQDAQAKALGEWLRARLVPIPDAVLDAEETATSPRSRGRP